MKFDPQLPADGVNVTPSHPLWELTLLLGGSAAVLGGLFIGLVFAVDLLVPQVPPAWEAKLFSDFGPDELTEDPRQEAASPLDPRSAVA